MKNLTAIESEEYFAQIISGSSVPENDIAEFLLALKEKGETTEEILGAIRAIKKTATLPTACGGDERGGSGEFTYRRDLPPRAKELRTNSTEAEKLLWNRLRAKSLGHKFRRQEPIGNFIADFVCHEKKLVIELDGGQHAEAPKDLHRTAELNKAGYQVIRFWNNEILENIEGVVENILQNVSGDALPQPLPQAGGGLIKQPLIDVCGTGGDGLHTLNISTAVAFVVAGTGVKVAKHGNKAVSSASGSSDVLAELGIKLDTDPLKSLEETNFGYFHAPLFYPALKNVASVRAKLKTRTIFNLLGPMLNPVGAERQIIGVYAPDLLRIYAEVLRELGLKKAWVVHGADGLDEVSISGETQICEMEAGAIDNFTLVPEDAGLRRYPLEGIKGGDAKHNAEKLEALLKGEKGAYREIVLLNAASALIVAGITNDLAEGARIAAESLDSGKSLKVLEKLREIKN